MQMRPIFRILCLFLLGAWSPSAAFAQDHPNYERGLSAATSYQGGDVDSVNLFNGQLHLSIPLGQVYPLGGGLTYGFGLHYNSNVWDFEDGASGTVAANPEIFGNAGLGWTLTLGRIYPPFSSPWNDSSSWLLLESDGTRRLFYPQLHHNDPINSLYGYTRDGSYLRMQQLAAGESTVESPDGTVRFFRADGRLRQITDSFGNYVNVSYNSTTGAWTLTDQHNRVQTVTLNNTADSRNGHVATLALDKFNSAEAATYTFAYTLAVIPRHYKDTATNSTYVSVPLLTSVAFPDGSSYAFAYYTTNATVDGFSQPAGALNRITLPTLGRFDYTYASYGFPKAPSGCGTPCLPEWNDTGDGLRTTKIYNAGGGLLGTWTYLQLRDDDDYDKTETRVTSPLGDTTRHFFRLSDLTWQHGLPYNPLVKDTSNSRFLSQEVYSGSVETGQKKRSIYLRFATDKPIGLKSNQRVESRRTLYHDDIVVQPSTLAYADVTFSKFDGLGQHRQVDTAGNFTSANVRTTFANYNSAVGTYDYDWTTDQFRTGHTFMMPAVTTRWRLDTYTDTSVKVGTQEIKTQVCLETTTSPITGPTGFVLGVRSLKGASPGANDLMATYTKGPGGNIVQERYWGGDLQTLGTQANPCSATLPSSDAYRIDNTYSNGVLSVAEVKTAAGGGLGMKIVNQTIEGSGLVSSRTDVGGIKVDYEYDAMARLTWEKPAAGHGAFVEHAYSRATSASQLARIDLRRRQSSKTGTILTEDKLFADAFGRLWKEERWMPDGARSTRETLYNAMGWTTSVSQWGNLAEKTSFSSFDPFGRPGLITPPDGSTHLVTQGFKGDRLVDRQVKVAIGSSEALTFTTEIYDRQGQLYQFIEASGLGGAYVTTTYGYDAANRLKSVQTPATATLPSGLNAQITQQRYFTYDNRGFLTSAQSPEKGASGNGTVTYSSYDALGRVGRIVDGPSNLTFTYDRGGRLKEVRDGASAALIETYSYATSNLTGNWRQGKLETADRYNYISIGATPFTVQIRESYVYGGVGGRVSSRTTSWANAASGDAFTQGWNHDQLGNVTTLTYPRCIHTGCTGNAAISRTGSFTYTRDALTAATSTSPISLPSMGTSTLTYRANGALATVSHANGVVWTKGADPDAFPRPASFDAKYGTTALWATGTYGYDASGNVKAIGSSTFYYDAVSRLKSTSLITSELGTGTPKTQSFTYDPFGNLTNISGTLGRSIPVEPATNRLVTVAAASCGASNVMYDAAGNLTCWHGNSYTYDKTGAVIRTHLSGNEYDHVYAPGGERILTYQPGVAYRWTLRDLDGKVLREMKNVGGTWTLERDYLYRGRTLLAAAQPSGEVYHLHPDHLGSPRLITGNGGVKRAFHAYYPYGEEATSITQVTERMKFTGHERDLGVTTSAADDLDYMHARYANPQLGRFLSVDPVNGSPWVPQSWNRYAYVMGNPTNLVDPYGLTGLSEDDPFTETIDVVGDPWDWSIPPGLLNFLFGGRSGSGGSGGKAKPSTQTWDSVSDQRIQQLHPCLQQKAYDFINDAESQLNINLRVSTGLRTFAEQDALYQQGRFGNPGLIVTGARGGQSYHNFGMAFDVAPISAGKVDWSVSWIDIGVLGESHGMEWGGRWKQPDNPHFQLPLGHTTKQLSKLTSQQIGALPCS